MQRITKNRIAFTSQARKGDTQEGGWKNVYPDGMNAEMLKAFQQYHDAKAALAAAIGKAVGGEVAINVTAYNVGFLRKTDQPKARKNAVTFND
jgi:mannose/cellobiose epimerase-like protein (N-acyl-D-glucosamine 2-epimerase family)